MRVKLDEIDTSQQPYVIVSSDTHAGLQVEEYRQYLDPRYRPQFDEWVVERHNHRRLVEEVNGAYVAKWEGENAEPIVRASRPGSGGNSASKRPASTLPSALTICPNGRTVRPTTQPTSQPPSVGARIGAMPSTSISSEKIRAES